MAAGYTPSTRELHPGPRNRLWLALRSGVAEEVDWALPRLVLASFERTDVFNFEAWVDAVTALRDWPTRWLEELEREAAYEEIIKSQGGAYNQKARAIALGAVPQWTRDPAVEQRATTSLQILRNATFMPTNAHAMARAHFDQFLFRFFDLPRGFLLEVATRSPEPIQHLLVIVHNMYQFLNCNPQTFKLLTEVLPYLAMDTRDLGMLLIILPILITTFNVQMFPPPPEGFIQHMLYLITINPPPALLELILDLLAAMAPQATYARTMLWDPDFPAHLKTLVHLLHYKQQPQEVNIAPPHAFRPVEALNPASEGAIARLASRRRAAERERDQQRMEMFNGPGVFREVGDAAPALPTSIKKELWAMTEPKRSINWMHETFVYSSHSQLLQVTFWHAYRDFFSNPATVEQLLSASEVIKNVQVAFPAAQAKLWADERGERKFVIAGLGFRNGTADTDRFACVWVDCPQRIGATNPAELLDHVQKTHLGIAPTTCGWGSCRKAPFSVKHLLTHLPPAEVPNVPETLPVYQTEPRDILQQALITNRPPPLLPLNQLLHFTVQMTETDATRQPTGVAFLAALTIRGLARNLRNEIAAARPEEMGLSDAQRKEKKKHLAEERFGLPIPINVLREEEEEEDEERGLAEAALPDKERERARAAFRAVEEKVLDVVNSNGAGLALYLGDAFGW